MKFSEKWGDSIDAAVELALTDLNLTREEVNITVLEEPTRGFFGLGSKLAKVRVEEKASEKEAAPKKEEVKKEAPKEKPKAEKNAKAEAKKNNNRKSRGADSYAYGEVKVLGERPADLVLAEDHPVKTFLTDVFSKMNLDINLKVYTNADSVYVDVDGPDSGTVIGKRGQTLDAIQYLSSLVVNKGEGGYIRVVLDAEGYRQKREITLEKLADRLADKAIRSGRPVRLEPMNPYERKVIHTALQRRPEVITKSEGEEPYRRVVIEPVK